MAMMHSANGLPDHGGGGLGRVAHAALTSPPAGSGGPRLFLGYNTLPHPPFPLIGYLEYDMDPRAADTEPAALLRAAADSMRAQPVPPTESFDDAHRRMAAAMRVDAMVLVVAARAVAPEGSPAAPEAAVALGVEREGARLVLTAEPDPAGEHPVPRRIAEEPHGTLFDLLGEVLDAQYRWTKAAFAL